MQPPVLWTRGMIGLSLLTPISMDSILLFFVGILGVYVARIHREVRRRPACIVSFARRSRRQGGGAA
jgi:hypothetical protein